MLVRMLLGRLNDFGPDNWTSELRHCIPDFPPFRGSSTSVYVDFTWAVGRGIVLRSSRRTARKAYSSGAVSHGLDADDYGACARLCGYGCSIDGVAQASTFSERTDVGTDIYVVVCISCTSMPEPSYMVYTDPHRALFYGHLQYAHDVFLQRNMEFQA